MTPKRFLQKSIAVCMACVVAIMLLPIRTSSPSYADNTPAPYIQYYSPVLGGIVVERADGTDSRVLGRGLISYRHTTVAGPGWSPTGEWFAWISWNPAFESATPSNAYIVSTDGSHHLTILDDLHSISLMQWLPDSDLLLVGNYIENSYPEPKATRFYLVDVPHEKIMQSFTLGGAANTYWSPDKHYLLIMEDFDFYFDEESGEEIKVLSTTGELIDFPLVSMGSIVQWHTDGRLLVLDAITHQLELLDLTTHEKMVAELPNTNFSHVWSHPSGQGLFVQMVTEDKKNYDELWYLDLETLEWQSFGMAILYASAVNDYLFKPENNRLLLFNKYSSEEQTRELAILDLETMGLSVVAENVQEAIWSPSGKYILYTKKSDQPESNDLVLYKVSNGLQYVVGTHGAFHIETYNTGYFSEDEDYLIYLNYDNIKVFDIQRKIEKPIGLPFEGYAEWVRSGQTLYILHGDVYQYDLSTGELLYLDHVRGEPTLSPDTKTLFYAGECAMSVHVQPRKEQFCLEDRQTGVQQAISPHSATWSGSMVSAEWHPDSEWLLVAASWTGMGDWERSITRRDGTHTRDLNANCSSYSSLCGGWVPEHIVVDKLLPPPENLGTNPITLNYPGNVTALAWSPDGTKLAVGFSTFYRPTYYANDETIGGLENAIEIWDMANFTILQSIPTARQQISGLDWSADGGYIAASITPPLDRTQLMGDSIADEIQELSRIQVWRATSGELVQTLDVMTETANISLYDWIHGTSRLPWPMPTPDFAIQHNFDGSHFEYAYDSYDMIWMIDVSSRKVIKIRDFSNPMTAASNRRGVFYLSIYYSDRIPQSPLARHINWQRLEHPRIPYFFAEATDQIAITSDESLLALSGPNLDEIVLWDLTTTRVVEKYYSSARALDFSPDGLQLAAAASYTVRIWEVSPQPLYIPQEWERLN